MNRFFLKLFLILFFSYNSLNFSKLYSQKYFNNFLKNYYSLNFDKAKSNLDEIKNYKLKALCKELVLVKESAGQNKITLSKKPLKLNNSEEFIYLISRGYNYLYNNPYSTESFELFREAYNLSKTINNKFFLKISLVSILDVYYNEIYKSNDECLAYINELKSLNSNVYDSYYYHIHFLHLKLREITDKLNVKTEFLNNFDLLMKKFDEGHPFNADYFSSKAILLKIDKEYDKAVSFFKKSISIAKNHLYLEYIVFRSSIHLAEINRINKKYKKSESYLKFASQYINNADTLSSNYFLNIYNSLLSYDKKEYKEAYDFLNKSSLQGIKLDYKKNISELTQLNVKYQIAETKNKVLISEQKIKQRNNLLVGSTLLSVLGLLIGYLIVKNTNRKRLLAEKQKELEKQKNITLIKEQEITTINAMVEGQEKERVRIAEDLHDNIGSVLATLKLNFENLKLNRKKKHFNQEELYSRTENLIDETYKKVRSIAHAKNAGVIANQGLLSAVKIMAEKISSANKTKIEVIDFGLHERIDNNLELSIFRIIQELTTNIIKHANAKNATINLSLFNSNLNIIIEDNGRGFDYSKTNLQNSMGLNSIKKRIKYFKGNFSVDSTVDRGTSIIIDIPI